jgi:hypothetical protein
MAATRLPTSGANPWLRSIRYSTSASRLLRLTCTWTKPNQLNVQAAGGQPLVTNCDNVQILSTSTS